MNMAETRIHNHHASHIQSVCELRRHARRGVGTFTTRKTPNIVPYIGEAEGGRFWIIDTMCLALNEKFKGNPTLPIPKLSNVHVNGIVISNTHV